MATGYDLFDARKMPQYGYGRLPNVFTSLEFERLSQLRRPDERQHRPARRRDRAEDRGIVHCVGSRDTQLQQLLLGDLLHAEPQVRAPGQGAHRAPTIYDFYIDMRTAGKGYDEFYQRILEEGGIFIRGKPAEITDVARTPEEEGKLIVQVEDTLIGQAAPHSRWTWSSSRPACEPRADAKELATRFGISCSFDGWAIEKHPKLDPVATMTEGVFVAGCVSGPKDIPASVAQGAAAAARVLGMIQQKQMNLEPIKATVHAEHCSGCRICNTMCPYNAISLRRGRGRLEHQRGDVPGLRHLRRGLPRRSHLRHGLQRRAGPGADRGPAPSRSRRRAAQADGLPRDPPRRNRGGGASMSTQAPVAPASSRRGGPGRPPSSR